MTDKRNVILAFLIISIIVYAIVISRDFPPATSDNVSTLRTINQSNQIGDLTFNNTPVDDNATWLEGGERSQNRLLYGGIISILVMQMIILVLIIRCRKHRTYRLKPKS